MYLILTLFMTSFVLLCHLTHFNSIDTLRFYWSKCISRLDTLYFYWLKFAYIGKSKIPWGSLDTLIG